jgi:isopenicillin N synthase-like dioxygenase
MRSPLRFDWSFPILPQVCNERGLRILNATGGWIDALPMDGILVNIAVGFEEIAGGLCPATTHRVLTAVKRPKYSVRFFMRIKFGSTLQDLKDNVPSMVQSLTGNKKVLLQIAERTVDSQRRYCYVTVLGSVLFLRWRSAFAKAHCQSSRCR